MLTRLLLALMLAVFAVPAAAQPCHGAPPATSHHVMPAMPDDKATPPAHVCIGCIPLGDWDAARIAVPAPPARIAAAGHITRLHLLNGGPPATPPPRAG